MSSHKHDDRSYPRDENPHSIGKLERRAENAPLQLENAERQLRIAHGLLAKGEEAIKGAVVTMERLAAFIRWQAEAGHRDGRHAAGGETPWEACDFYTCKAARKALS